MKILDPINKALVGDLIGIGRRFNEFFGVNVVDRMRHLFQEIDENEAKDKTSPLSAIGKTNTL
jgi:hypothetical protein